MRVEICKLDSNRNLSDRELKWLVQSIKSFIDNVSPEEARLHAGNMSNAFSYYALPALDSSYSSTFTFDKESIKQENHSRVRNSNPAALATLCRKDGLLYSVGDIFKASEITEKLLYTKRLSAEEFMFFLLSKQWIRVDASCRKLLLATIYECAIGDDGFLDLFNDLDHNTDTIISKIFKHVTNQDFSSTDDRIDFKRFDILKNALLLSGLFTNSNGSIKLSQDGSNILKDISDKQNLFSTYGATDIEFYNYICACNYGILDIITGENAEIYKQIYPNLVNLALETQAKSKMTTPPIDNPLQIIYYGAPGTGKSDSIDRICKKYIHYRTTFHPDSDYASFVGCYKPVNKILPFDDNTPLKSEQELTDLWNNSTLPYMEFSGKYYKSLKDLPGSSKANIFTNNAINSRQLTPSIVSAEISKGVRAANEYSKSLRDSKISYEFTPQVFTNAYIEAWKDQSKPVFLIIEEINRGNCAQIFGDLFQLLDRDDNGYSKYETTPDTDLQNYISSRGGLAVEGILDSNGKDISQDINNGKLLKLPCNLYIWATMNTSDQSLFPIDSAFKRRWDWKYIKITEGIKKNPDGTPVYVVDENGDQIKKKLNWALKFGDVKINNEDSYNWWRFIQKLNTIIAKMTDSADKQLGYFFCKANNDGVINADAFVSKVVFYLWNDVFKDYGFEDPQLFGYSAKDGNGNDCKKTLSFPDFFDEEGNIDATIAAVFVKNIIDWQESKNN